MTCGRFFLGVWMAFPSFDRCLCNSNLHSRIDLYLDLGWGLSSEINFVSTFVQNSHCPNSCPRLPLFRRVPSFVLPLTAVSPLFVNVGRS